MVLEQLATQLEDCQAGPDFPPYTKINSGTMTDLNVF